MSSDGIGYRNTGATSEIFIHGVEISPLLVATMKRLPQRTIESTLPTLGTVCPGITLQTPFGPSNTAVPLVTSRSVRPGMLVGLVSGVGESFVELRSSPALTPVRCTPVECLPGTVPTEAVDAEDRVKLCSVAASASRST